MRIGIAGYGNLGRALEIAVRDADDIEAVGVFTRRKDVKTYGAPIYGIGELASMREKIDVLALCYGSSSDLPRLAPDLAEMFNTVDTFDNHSAVGEYKRRMDESAKRGGNCSVISLGWDPGLLSLMRLYLSAFLPSGVVNTFWGRGVSQGHSEALRKIDGVKRAVQYTVPREDALTLASLVRHPLDDTDKHRRVCYICAEKEKEDRIRDEILSMENYFSGYETEIHFVDESDPYLDTGSMAHRGRVYALGSSGVYNENKHSLYLNLEIGSNPELTANIMLRGAIACYRLKREGSSGAYTAFDIPPIYFNRENANYYL